MVHGPLWRTGALGWAVAVSGAAVRRAHFQWERVWPGGRLRGIAVEEPHHPPAPRTISRQPHWRARRRHASLSQGGQGSQLQVS